MEDEDDTSVLFIKDIVFEDSGSYTCKSGSLYKAVFLSVNGKILIEYWGTIFVVSVGISFPDLSLHQTCTLTSSCFVKCKVRAPSSARIDFRREDAKLIGKNFLWNSRINTWIRTKLWGD